LILGSGISGLLHLLLARVSGVGRIFASDIHEFRLDTARNFGADTVFHAGEDIPKMLEKKNKRLADLVIVCTGAASAFEQAFESVDRGGTILFFASPDPGVKVDFPVNQFWRNSIRCLTSYGNSPLDAEIAIELIRSRRVRVQPMITHRFPLAQTAMGFKLTADGSDSLKIIIEPQRK
jgi:L-iditol 2-dehydrogenase